MFLLIDNYDSFTFNLVQAFQRQGRDPLVKKNDDPAVLDLATDPALEMVCLSPGPSRPENAGLCLEFLARLPHAVPVLGVCLGHQTLGLFAGAPVVVNSRIMHGKTSEVDHDATGLFTGLPRPVTVGRYHSLVVVSPRRPGRGPGPAARHRAHGPGRGHGPGIHTEPPLGGRAVPSRIGADSGRRAPARQFPPRPCCPDRLLKNQNPQVVPTW
jgi:anthranilate synthase component 2